MHCFLQGRTHRGKTGAISLPVLLDQEVDTLLITDLHFVEPVNVEVAVDAEVGGRLQGARTLAPQPGGQPGLQQTIVHNAR